MPQRMDLEDTAALARRADALRADGRRHLLGIVGSPGAGKSTLARLVCDQLEQCVVVPMDGFHLAHTQIEKQGKVDTKGAIDTFDAHGYVALIERIARDTSTTIYAPEYRRTIEDGIAGAIPVTPTDTLVITDGNYLLVDADPWSRLTQTIDEFWFVEPPEDLRVERLIARHIESGKTPQHARRQSLGSDEDNAALIRSCRDRATVVVS